MEQKTDWNFKLVRYFLRNRQLTVLLFVIVVFGGMFSFLNLRVEGFPEVPVPFAIVTTVVPGASPESIDDLVTQPIEAQIEGIKGIKNINSNSANSVSSIVLQLEGGTDSNSVVQEIRTKLSGVSLPDAAQDPRVFVPETGGAPFVVAITGNKSLDELYQDSQSFLEELKNIKFVSSVSHFGSANEQIVIKVGEEFYTPALTGQIKSSTLGFPLGEAQVDGKLVPLVADSKVKNIEDLKNLPIYFDSENGLVVKRLSDIADVYQELDDKGEVNRVGFRDDGVFRIQSAVLLTIRLEKDADVIKLGEDVQNALSELNGERSDDTRAVLVYNQAEYSKAQIKEITEGAFGGKWNSWDSFGNVGYVFGGVWLLLIVMLLFLDWRSALVSIISIPLSFLTTFLVLRVLGIQLNTIVLFSLVLVLGLIVDPAIVVLESMKRYMEIGYKGTEATLRSVSVIGQGIFIAVLTSLIVFVPFAVVSGTFGEIIKYIPLTVIPALLASYFIPMVFLTWLGSKVLKSKEGAELKDENDPHTLWPVAQWFIRANRYILKHTWLSIIVVILGLVVPIGVATTFIANGSIKQVQFSSPPDSELLAVNVPFSANADKESRLMENSRLENVLKNYAKYTKNYYYASIDGDSTSASMSVILELLPPADRDVKSPEIAKELNADLRNEFGERAFATELSAGPPEESYPVSVSIFDNDEEVLNAASVKIAEQLRTYPEVTAVKYDFLDKVKNLTVSLDLDKAGLRGLTTESFYGQLAGLFSEQSVTSVNGLDVVLTVDGANVFTNGKESLENRQVFGSQGPVRVKDVATVIESETPGNIRRIGGEQFARVEARVSDTRDIIKIQRDITNWAKDNRENLGVGERAFEDRAGINEFEKSFQELFLAIALSILLTYIVFVLFFKSFIQPFIILFAIPLLAVGIFPALVIWARGQLGFLEILGVIMVIGIVENVGIFLIDFANRKVAEGVDKREAVALSSGIRFRPIILTKLTTLAGLLPLAIFAPFWRGLAVVVIMGIISSGILSLFTTPVLYSWFTRNPKPKAELT